MLKYSDFILKVLAMVLAFVLVDRMASCEEHGHTEERIGTESEARRAEANRDSARIYDKQRAAKAVH